MVSEGFEMTATMYFIDHHGGWIDITVSGGTQEELRASFEAAMVELYGQADTPTP